MAKATKKTTAQLIANPAWRKNVKDVDLQKARPDLYQKRLAKRKVDQENATLYNPNAILSGAPLRSAVKGLVDADINPQLSAYDRAIGDVGAQTTARQATSNAQYDAQQKNLSDEAYAAQQNTARAAGAQAQLQNNVVSTLGAQGAAQQGYVDQLAKNIGVDIGGGAQVAQQTAQLQQQATAQGNQRQIEATQIGSGYEALLQAMAGASTLQKGEAATKIGAKGQADMSDLMGKRTDVAASRGPLTTKYATQMRQTQFTNSAAAKAYNLDVIQEKNDVATDLAKLQLGKDNRDIAQQNADTRETQVTAGIDQGLQRIQISRQNAETNRINAEKDVGGNGKDKFGNTVIQRRAANDAFTKARSLARQAGGSFKDPNDLYSYLISSDGGGLNPTIARAAAQQVKLGYVGDKTYNELRKRGVAGGFNRKKTTTNRPTSVGGRPHG